MKHLKTVLLILIILQSFISISCASRPENQMDSVYVMVYDYDNSGVMNAAIFVDGKNAGVTDIYGRLIFSCPKERSAVIRVEKNGFETVETEVFLKPGTVIYFKTGSGSYYAQRAEKLLDEKDVKGALGMIKKALEIQERKDWRYLMEIILRENKSDE